MNESQLSEWLSQQLEVNNSFKSETSNERLKEIIGCIDLTSLNSTDDDASILQFVHNGIQIIKEANVPNVAAVCVFSNFAQLVSNELKGTGISTACVAAAFPHGQAILDSKIKEVELAALAGADDIDIVINRGLVLSGEYDEMESEIFAFKNAAGKAHLKVILEVSELNYSQVYEASIRAIRAGANFLKTSTGKGSSGASLESSLLMCKAINEHWKDTGEMVGFKAAGGISTSENANQYFNLVKTMLGNKWANNSYFRIGASSLLKNIITDIN